MFSNAKTIARQGEKIIELNKKNYEVSRENLKLIGTIDDMQDEFLNILDTLEEILTTQNYNRPDLVISKAIAEIKYQKQIIEEDKKIELADCESN
jgi:hypothetical protein